MVQDFFNLKLRNLRRSRNAFTLIEILIVVGITALLSGMVLTYSSRGRSQTVLYVESAKLAQVILRAKSLAVATFVGGGGTAPCGYGVHLDYSAKPASYTLFSYAPVDNKGILACSGIAGSSIDTSAGNGYSAIDSFSLPNEVIFDPNNSGMLKDVFFMPPDPTTNIWDNSSLPQSAAPISLVSSQDNASFIRITVSAAGQINF